MDTGQHGEHLARRYLQRRGWLILTRNWCGAGGELDIVARRRGVLAIVEVKTRADAQQLLEPISLAQRARISRAARAFVQRHPHLNRLAVRFDLITVDRSGLVARLDHIVNAFDPPIRRTGAAPDRRVS